MLRKTLSSTGFSGKIIHGGAQRAGGQTSSAYVKSLSSPLFGIGAASVAATNATTAFCRPTQPRLMFQGHAVQNQWTSDSQNYAGRRSDYDFDKEAWAKQMKFASFDCIMEPSIVPPKYASFAGIKKNIRRYLNMKKLTERRPGYNPKDLQELFIRYKYLLNSKNLADSKMLLRLTTHTEAARIEKEISKRANNDFKNKSWGSLKMDLKKGGANGANKKSTTQGADEANASKSDAASPSLVSAANNANDVVLLIKKPEDYDIHVSEFQMVTTYMAQMAAEDWLQMTFKCEYFEKTLEDGEKSVAAADSSSTLSEDAETAKKDKAAFEKELLDKGYTKVLEYPCFELRMGDGAAGGVQYPFIVLGVMRRDGTRYGRDAQDAASLRKQFDRNSSWFS